MQAMLAGMNKEKLQQLVQRMTVLKQQGENENTSQEYAKLLKLFQTFSRYQAMKQQQQQQAVAAAQAQQAGATATATAAAASSSSASTSQTQTNGNDAATAPAETANGSASTPAAPTASFTPDQLAALKAQIMAYKLISRNMPVPVDIQNAIFGRVTAMAELRSKMGYVRAERPRVCWR